MRRHKLWFPAFVALATAFLILTPSGKVASQAIREVFVVNLPEVQKVEGKISLAEPVRLAQVAAYEDITVPPVAPSDTTRLVDAGLLVTDGFPSVVLSLHGSVKGSVQKPGAIGAILIPDEPTIQEAFDDRGLMHFRLETVAAGVNSGTPYFASKQPRYTVGFPAYRVFLYNTTDKTVSANLYAYLTN